MDKVAPVEVPSLKMPPPMPPQTPTMAEDDMEEDSPGVYVITHHNTFVSDEAKIPPSEQEVTAKLEEGREVSVLEVVEVPEQNRIRARIQNPPGWISLMNVKEGHRWAKKRVNDEEALRGLQADIQNVLQDNGSLHEKVAVLANKMESLRTCNLELASKASAVNNGSMNQSAPAEHGGAGCSN